MSIFNQADSARFPYKSGFNLSYEKNTDIEFGKLNILNAEFICPGDIVHASENIILRFQAQFAPFFTPITATIRNWFVPLRLIEENTEWIITGSKNGKIIKEEGVEVEIPTFDKLFDYEKDNVSGHHKVKIGGIVEQMFGMPTKRADGTTDLDYSGIADNKIIPALYWIKAYYRIWFDYYRDENLFDYEDFDDWWSAILAEGKIGQQDLLPVNWKKDYLMSALYSQQKGIAPALNPFLTSPAYSVPLSMIGDSQTSVSGKSFTEAFGIAGDTSTKPIIGLINDNKNSGVGDGYATTPYKVDDVSSNITLNAQNNYKYSALGVNSRDFQAGFNATELRLLFAQQKIFERLMRCGSRYVEYLMSNFGIAPADETLQRVQYLGGFKQAVVTSEVLQTGTDSSNPVGTQRGHSISVGGNSLGKNFFKEFGVMITTISVMPKAIYAQGINRKYGLVERFDFPNPSFQFLSEDEVLNGEIFTDIDTDSGGNYLNDKTFGFQEMYAWLKSNRDMVIGNLRGTERYWTMLRWFSQRPNLNEATLTSVNDGTNFSVPFAVTDKPPIIMRAGNVVHMWRNFAKYGTPGLLDHY